MILASPGYLILLALAAWILLLHFLHARRERHEVAWMPLWENLPHDPRVRAARLRIRWSSLIFLQLLVLAALTLALAGPAWITRRPSLASLAIVLDGSASLRALSASGRPTADLIRAEALSLLDRYSSTPTAVLELSTSPRVVAPLSSDPADARRAITAWSPTWFADGSEDDLRGLLASQGGGFERVVLLTDTDPVFSVSGLEVRDFAAGENVALAAFSAREDPRGTGAIAFVRVRNDTSAYREFSVRVSDGAMSTSLPVILAPEEEQAYVLPFPGSLGPVFSASIDGEDAFAADDSRTFSLARPLELRVRIVGQADRYLRAALTSVRGVRLLDVSDPDVADITVAYGVTLPADTPGSVFLVRSSLPGVVEVGDERERDSGLVVAVHPEDPVLEGVDPQDLIVPRAPRIQERVEGKALLSAGEEPILWRSESEERRVVLLSPDLMKTNLPLAVDFPILVRNIVYWLSLASPSAPPHAATAGTAIAFAPYGTPERLKDPSGRETGVDATAYGFMPKAPGIYQLSTSSGTYPIAVNVDPSESPRAPATSRPAGDAGGEVGDSAGMSLRPLWMLLAALGLCLLVAESIVYHRPGLLRRKT